MCLQTKSLPGDIIKSCEPSKVLKGALVAYKIASLNTRNPKNLRVESIFFDRRIVPGWNKDNKSKRTLKSYDEWGAFRFSYTAGLHLFSSSQMAIEQNNRHFFAHIIPVHFYPKDVIAEGTEGSEYIGLDFIPIEVVVVSKFFVRKVDHKEITDEYEKSIM